MYVKNEILLIDNVGAYSVNVFYITFFNIVHLHGLNLYGVIHEAQDGKS